MCRPQRAVISSLTIRNLVHRASRVCKVYEQEQEQNIGERLGTKNGYNGYARADFIKAMFPDVMKDIEQDSIRNFKFQPNKGSIVIDEPDEDD